MYKRSDNMIKNEIELKSLNSFGIAKAYVDKNAVSIRVYGVSGCLKAWLTGKRTIEIGNLVNGFIKKDIDTSPFDGILLTQSGRQMFYGKFSSSEADCINKVPDKAAIFRRLPQSSFRQITSPYATY